jgi:lycopene beta-cyclase
MIEPGVFWQDGPSTWEQSVTKKWDLALFVNSDFRRFRVKPYTYKPNHSF